MSEQDKQISELLRAAAEKDRAGDLPGAEQLYRALLKIDGQNIAGLNGLGVIALRLNRLDAAEQLFTLSLQAEASHGATHRYLGNVFSRRNDHERGLALYEEALRLNPQDQKAAEFIEQTRQAINLGEDPDYAVNREAPWADTDWAWEEIFGNPTLFVLFAGLGVNNNPPTFIFNRFLQQYPQIDRLYLRDLQGGWYQNGLGDLSVDVETTAAFIAGKITAYERTVFVGASAGGMAALLYGQLLGPSKILAFAPQTVLSEAKENDYRDRRWHPQMLALREKAANPDYLDLRNLNPFTVRTDIHYASNERFDRQHAERVQGDSLRRFAHDDAKGHLIALHLRDTGELRKIIEAEIE